MSGLTVVVEGQTEERFVKSVLIPHLGNLGIVASAMIVATKRDPKTGQKLAKGGGRWGQWKRDIQGVLRNGSQWVNVTTMLDFHALHHSFPGVSMSYQHSKPLETVRKLEAAMKAEIDDYRFVPYIQCHEFEALVLAGIKKYWRDVFDKPDQRKGVESVIRDIGSTPPEEVDGGDETAPSKRLLSHIPDYDEIIHGVAIGKC